MIIKNNFNKKNTNPLTDYQEVGKGINSLDKYFEQAKNGVPRENIDNKVIRDILAKDKEYEEDVNEIKDKWDFFR